MKGLHFRLTESRDPAVAARLRNARIIGYERMPWATLVELHDDLVSFSRAISESGSIHLPWPVQDFGHVIVQTSSLMLRAEPYDLLRELARGQVGKARNELQRCLAASIPVGESVRQLVDRATADLRTSLRAQTPEDADLRALDAMRNALWGGELLTEVAARHALGARRQLPRFRPPMLGCVVDDWMVEHADRGDIARLFDHLSIPLNWSDLEPDQGKFQWERLDRWIGWCTELGLPFTIGPLVDFNNDKLPRWLSNWQRDPSVLVGIMLDQVESCMARYRRSVASWESVARTNSTQALGLTEEQLLWISVRLPEAANSMDKNAEQSFTADQPWGDYVVEQEKSHSPFTFVDTLLRNQAPLTSIGLEVAMGMPGGSFCRSLLDVSHLLDMFGSLGVKLRVRLLFPSSALGDPEECGMWHGPPSEEIQADWAERMLLVAVSKPAVELVTWGRYHDEAGSSTTTGLVTQDGAPKKIMERLRGFRRSQL